MFMKFQTKPKRLIRLPEVIKTTGLKRSTIYKKMADGDFPRPVKLGQRSVGWADTAIDQWIENARRGADS